MVSPLINSGGNMLCNTSILIRAILSKFFLKKNRPIKIEQKSTSQNKKMNIQDIKTTHICLMLIFAMMLQIPPTVQFVIF